MFSGEVIPAVTAKLLGQDCCVSYGPFSHLLPRSGHLPSRRPDFWRKCCGGSDV